MNYIVAQTVLPGKKKKNKSSNQETKKNLETKQKKQGTRNDYQRSKADKSHCILSTHKVPLDINSL